ncbi:probable G-protein coupled receptor CG31760 [Bacillus rossius redtenbacheri]|uniref:probable G-protein coupled receptor CG31760 n=1 Tax=Bacillus rossius redtenbacheri TaxID=93214 RepID=UPI002FDCB092
MASQWLGTTLLLATLLSSLSIAEMHGSEVAERALQAIHDVATANLGSLCVTELYRSLGAAVLTGRFEAIRQKADMAAALLHELGVSKHEGVLDALARGLLGAERLVLAARALALNSSTGSVAAAALWRRQPDRSPLLELDEPRRDPGERLDPALLPWYEEAGSSPQLRSPKFMASPGETAYRGWFTFPYYSCGVRRWLVSYSVAVPLRRGLKGYLSLDIDVSGLEVNQCDEPDGGTRPASLQNQIQAFWGTHKCHNESTKCQPRPGRHWARGAYECVCRDGFYSARHPAGFDGALVEAAWSEQRANVSSLYEEVFRCSACAPGCRRCKDGSPCLAPYNWAFRITLLTASCCCALFTLVLVGYVYQHRRIKVFKVASPIFLCITLLGCAVMYLEMAAIFPVLDVYACIATKWTRHLGFCITYTALLMKTWRVSLTYRVKSAHKVKLTDKQLLQWMFPILLVMLIYLGTWTLSAPPAAEVIVDEAGLEFKQCVYNWWDHSLAIGEILFLAWGIKVCYNVRNAESLYNEARLISYAIYNIALVNTAMIAFHLFLLPRAGPDIKYLLGFIRTQLSTSVTVGLVFGPKVVRVLRGQGDQWDNRARARGVTASFSLNGIGLVPEETADLFQENEELKEEIQKLAAQIEFMKIVHMEMNNRHLKPKPGGYFNSAMVSVQSPPVGKTGGGAKGPAEEADGGGATERV